MVQFYSDLDVPAPTAAVVDVAAVHLGGWLVARVDGRDPLGFDLYAVVSVLLSAMLWPIGEMAHSTS